MMLKVLVALCLVCFVAGETIVSFELNKSEGQVYAISTNYTLYEIDNAIVQQNNRHIISANIPPDYSSAYLKKLNGQKSLFLTLSDFDASQIIKLNLPFANRPVLTPSSLSPPMQYYTSSPTVFDDKDLIALVLNNGDNLVVFDIATLSMTSTTRVVNGVRRAATGLTYNFKNNHAVIFQYFFSPQYRIYNLRVSEYEIVNGLATYVESTFQYSDEFNNSRLVYAAFDKSNNQYWALDETSQRLIRFNSQNLADYSFIPLPELIPEIDTSVVSYNFGAQLAYVSSLATDGYLLQEVDLSLGAIRRSKPFNTGGSSPSTSYLDVEEGNLYVGLNNAPEAPASISVVDLGSLNQQLIVLV